MNHTHHDSSCYDAHGEATHAIDVPEQAERLGSVLLWFDDDDVEGGWIASINAPGQYEYDLDERFDSPGKALDGVIKWAKDRGLHVEDTHSYPLIRPGSPR